MMGLLGIVGTVAFAAGPMLEFAVQSGVELRRLRDADLRSAEAGERISQELSLIESGNERLRELSRLCPTAKHPAALAVLETAAASVVAAQTAALVSLRLERSRLAAFGSTFLSDATRAAPRGSCPLPTPLIWMRTPVFVHSETRAGFTAQSGPGRPAWRFSNIEVRPL
jgi:hypothetical protein